MSSSLFELFFGKRTDNQAVVDQSVKNLQRRQRQQNRMADREQWEMKQEQNRARVALQNAHDEAVEARRFGTVVDHTFDDVADEVRDHLQQADYRRRNVAAHRRMAMVAGQQATQLNIQAVDMQVRMERAKAMLAIMREEFKLPPARILKLLEKWSTDHVANREAHATLQEGMEEDTNDVLGEKTTGEAIFDEEDVQKRLNRRIDELRQQHQFDSTIKDAPDVRDFSLMERLLALENSSTSAPPQQ